MDKVIKQLDENISSKESKKELVGTLKKIYRFISKIFVYLMTLFLIVTVVMFIAYFVDMVINVKNHTTKQSLFGAYIIVSPSMVPTIKVNDAVIIKRVSKNKLKKGDIITFTSSDTRYYGLTITHRINKVEKLKNGDVLYKTKGDNNNTVDASLVKFDNVYGKVIFKIPKIGYIQYFLKTPLGWLILVIIPCICIVLYDFIKIINAINGRKERIKKHDKVIYSEEIIGNDSDTEIVDDKNSVLKKEKEKMDSEII